MRIRRLLSYHLLIAWHSVRALINAADPTYKVTAQRLPAFLYEDPNAYDADNILTGFMRGPFLLQVSKTYFNVMHLSVLSVLPSAVCQLCKCSCRLVDKAGSRSIRPGENIRHTKNNYAPPRLYRNPSKFSVLVCLDRRMTPEPRRGFLSPWRRGGRA